MPSTIKITAIRLSQPIGELFIGRVPARALIELAEADIRRITDREMEIMSGIQRSLSQSRVPQIRKYIETVDASFPNSIILNLDSKFLMSRPEPLPNGCSDDGLYCVEIARDKNAFKIIDGQHRLSGFKGAKTDDFDLLVAFFIDLPVEDQAYLFSTINVNQTKVNKSLVYDLFEVSEGRSPQRTAHLITKALNTDEDSPFYRRIKLLGVAPKFGDEVLYKAPLSQGTVAQRIVDTISADPMSDRDTIRRGNQVAQSDADVEKGLIFRKLFAEDKDWAILRIMKNYFRAVAGAFPDLWERQDNPLAKTIGYGALMRLLVDAYSVGSKNDDLSFDYFSSLFARVKENSERDEMMPLTFESFPAAGSGESKLYGKLKEWAELA
jgi:DGQHR domain-containing protein